MAAHEPILQTHPHPSFYVREIPIYGDVILSPMDGYSDQPFRSLCRALGSAVSYTEFVNVKDVLNRAGYVSEKLTFTEAERPVAIQLYGDEPDEILRAALAVREQNPDYIDINMGCPAKKISARGAGVGLMRTPETVAQIFSTLTRYLDIPITGKMRLGWDAEQRNYLEIARIVEDSGGALLAVHGRTRAQGYGGLADWDAIGEIVQSLAIPVLGNGDITSLGRINQIKTHTGCAGVMVGRAAMTNPWIFAGYDREHVTPEQLERTMLHHLEMNVKFYGQERGLLLFRKYAARYLTPYKLPKEVRERLFTCALPEEFTTLLRDLLTHPLPIPIFEPIKTVW